MNNIIRYEIHVNLDGEPELWNEAASVKEALKEFREVQDMFPGKQVSILEIYDDGTAENIISTPPHNEESTMHVKPIVSDGQFTIGYDADGVAGQWPGNMTETCEPLDWMPAQIDQDFSDGSMVYFTTMDGDQIVWSNPDGTITPVREILEADSDK